MSTSAGSVTLKELTLLGRWDPDTGELRWGNGEGDVEGRRLPRSIELRWSRKDVGVEVEAKDFPRPDSAEGGLTLGLDSTPCPCVAPDLALCGVVSTIEAFSRRPASRGASTPSAHGVRGALASEVVLERGQGDPGVLGFAEGVDKTFCALDAVSSFLVADTDGESCERLSCTRVLDASAPG